MADQPYGFALGVDLGTSNTVAVLRWPDGRTRPLLVDGQPILPSGVYADHEGRLHVGRDAQRLAQAEPTRYEAHPKRRIDDRSVRLGDREYAPADLLAATLRTVADSAVAATGFLPPAVLTCPATWNEARRQVLADALARAGWPAAAEHTMAGPIPAGTRLLREPVAAARYYTEVLRRPVPMGTAIAVFDLGGGTLDVAVVRNEGADPWGDSGFEVIAAGGIDDLGGLDLDAALVARLGELVAAEHPAQWKQLEQPADTGQWRARHQLWDTVRGAKEMLSRTTVAPVAVPGVEVAVQLTRADLERVATPLLRRAVTETRNVIAAAGLAPEQLTGLFLVGGATRTPLVARLLHADLGVAPTVLEQPELPVAEGALTDLPTRPAPRSGPPVAVPVSAAPASPAVAPASTPPGGASPHLGVPGSAAPYPGVPGSAPPYSRAPGSAAPASPAPVPGSGPPAAPAVPHGSAVPGGAAPYPILGPGGTVREIPGFGAPAGPPPPGTGGNGSANRRRRALWITAGAVVALAGVVTAAVLYLTRDRYPELEYLHSVSEVARIPTGAADRPGDMFTAVLGDRAYVAWPSEDDHLEVVAVDVTTGSQRWRTRTGSTAQQWYGLASVPGGIAVYADAAGDSTPRDMTVFDAGTGAQRWTRPIHGNDQVHFSKDTAVLADQEGHRLVGLRLTDGEPKWTLDYPRDQRGGQRATVRVVGGEKGATGRPPCLGRRVTRTATPPSGWC
ncbi:Hsp70 family protein [Micromonospora zhanjiangensis]